MSIFEKYNAVINTSPSDYSFLTSKENYIHLPVLVKLLYVSILTDSQRMVKAIKIN